MKVKVLIACVLITVCFLDGNAQENDKRFGIELNGGPSFATKKLGDADLKTGMGFEGIFHYRFMPHLGIYTGWGWNGFSSKKSFAGTNTDFDETGYVLGLQFCHPIEKSSISYYLRMGALYNHIELENEEGDNLGDTGHGFGLQLAGGIDLPLGSNWSLTPGVKFNYLSGDIEISGTTSQIDLNYWSLRVGILKKF